MKYLLSSVLCLALVAVVTGCDAVDTADATIAQASDNAAVVLNTAQDDVTCFINTPIGFGTDGRVTYVRNSGDQTNFSCHTELAEGFTAPDKTERFEGGGPNGTTCKIQVTPSGRMSANCH